jgi:hypothetical protein
MSGLTPLIDTLLATRLAQRVDLVPLKSEVEVAGPEAAAKVEKVINDVRLPSRAALQQLGVGLLKADQRGHGSAPAGAGGTVTLSVAARAVSAILEADTGAASKITGTEPLLPRAQPVLPQALAAALARTVANSGLFYESHLAQYAAGTRTRAELAQEPQARLDATLKVARAPGAAGENSGAAGTGTGAGRLMDLPALPGAALAPSAAGDALPMAADKAGAPPVPGHSLPAAAAAGPEQASAEGPHVRAHGNAAMAGAAEPDARVKSHDAGSSEASRSSAPGLAGVHPDTITLVRQQLELLAVPVFRWGGEIRPGTPMDWEIREEHDEREAAADGEAAARTWSTRLALALPTLKDVEVRISLSGSTLQVHLAAREDATRDLLSQGRVELPKRLEALGLKLAGVQIGALPAAQETPKDDDAR